MLIGDIMNNSKKLVICTLIITLLVLAAAASPYSINADAFENVLGKVVFVFVLIVVISTATILNHLMLKDFEGKPDEGFRLPITEFFFGGKRSYIADKQRLDIPAVFFVYKSSSAAYLADYCKCGSPVYMH